jgi:hypothetical protein
LGQTTACGSIVSSPAGPIAGKVYYDPPDLLTHSPSTIAGETTRRMRLARNDRSASFDYARENQRAPLRMLRYG